MGYANLVSSPAWPRIQSLLILIVVGIFIIVALKVLYDWYIEQRRHSGYSSRRTRSDLNTDFVSIVVISIPRLNNVARKLFGRDEPARNLEWLPVVLEAIGVRDVLVVPVGEARMARHHRLMIRSATRDLRRDEYDYAHNLVERCLGGWWTRMWALLEYDGRWGRGWIIMPWE